MVHSTEYSTVPNQRTSRQDQDSWTDVRLEAVPRLEWSLATEAHPRQERAASPSALRTSWIHTAPEEQVLELFRKLDDGEGELPSPWWLRALDRGEIASRAAAFEIEDEIHTLLTGRSGWVFVPWADIGETGYWEYAPSDRESVTMPTTVVMTDRHQGWVHVVAAHGDSVPLPLPVNKAPGLLSALPLIESY